MVKKVFFPLIAMKEPISDNGANVSVNFGSTPVALPPMARAGFTSVSPFRTLQPLKEIDMNSMTVPRVDIELEFKPGVLFNGEEEAYEAYNTYAFKMGFGVRRGNKVYNRKHELRRCTFLCCCEGYPPELLPNEERKVERTIKRCGCKALIKFKVEGEVWEVIEFVAEHNHAFIEDNQKHLIRSCRKITDSSKGALTSLVGAGIRATKAYAFLKNEAGGLENVGFTLRDCQNFLETKRRSMISAGDCQSLLNHLVSLQTEGHNLYYAFQMDEDSRMANFFWSDGSSRLDYDHFGDVVVFDTTYRTNKYNMICAPFVGINQHWKNVLFGCAFLLDETVQSFIWTFQTFLAAMGGKAPKTIFTDRDQAMANAIQQVFPGTTHRLCLWHIEKNAAQHISHLLKDKEFCNQYWKRILYDVQSEWEMEHMWKAMYDKWELQNNSWLNGMFDLRRKWCPAFSLDAFSAGILSTQRSESTNNVFQQMACKTMTLSEFVHHYEEQAEKMRDVEVGDDFECARGTPRLFVKDSGILKHAAQVYTLAIFKKFQDEFVQITSLRIVGADCSQTRHIYFLENESDMKRYMVEHSVDDGSISCSCKMFEAKGWLCRHALCIMTHLLHFSCIPSRYILPRWSKSVKRKEYSINLRSSPSSTRTLRLNKLMREAFKVMSLSASTDVTEEIAVEGLKHILGRVTKVLSSSTSVDRQISHKDITTFVKDDLNIQVQDPLKRRPKGIANARLKSSLEKRRKKMPHKAGYSTTCQTTQSSTLSSIQSTNCNLPLLYMAASHSPTMSRALQGPSFGFSNQVCSSDSLAEDCPGIQRVSSK